MSAPVWWYVVTPEYDAVHDIIDGYYIYVPARDVVCVSAFTRSDAKAKGLKELRDNKSEWVRRHSGNPFKGLRVEPCDSPPDDIGGFNEQ